MSLNGSESATNLSNCLRSASTGINLRASHSFGCWLRWNNIGDGFSNVGLAFASSGFASGSAIWHIAGDGANTLQFTRQDTFGFNDKVSSGSGYTSTSAWVHVVFVYDAPNTDILAYVNGASVGTVNSATTRCTSTTTTYLHFGPGVLDATDVFFYSRILSATEIARLATCRGLPIDRTSLGLWIPTTDSTSLTSAEQDWSGANLDMAALGTNTAVSNVGPPVPWVQRQGARIYTRRTTTPVNFSSGAATTTTAASSSSLRVAKHVAGAATTTTASSSSTLRVARVFAGSANSPTASASTLESRVIFSAASAASPTAAAATLANLILFDGGMARSPTASAAEIQARVVFAGQALSPSASTGTLAVGKLFAGSSTSPTASAATLNTVVPFTAGSAVSPTASAATLAAQKLFAGQALSPTASTGQLDVPTAVNFAGTATTTTAATSAFTSTRDFAGLARTPTAATGGLQAGIVFAGMATSPTASTAFLGASREFAGLSRTTTAATGNLTGGPTAGIPAEDQANTQKRRAFAVNQFRRRGRA